MNLNEIYTELIMDHNRSKHNKGMIEDADKSVRGHNPNCGDDLTVSIKLEGDILKDIKYSGSGCAISEASSSIMIDLLKGTTIEEAKFKINLFMSMIKNEISDDIAEKELLDATILSNIKNMPARVKCAVLAWHSLEQAIQKS